VRLIAAAALLLPALAACKVERTPREFYTQRNPARIDQQEAAGEIRDRVRNFAEDLGRGDRAGAVEALAPLDLALVIGVADQAGLTRLGRAGLAAELDTLQLPVPAVARTPDLAVQVGLTDGMGWFSTHLELLPVAGAAREPMRLRASGVFTRDRGEWRLSALHLSRGEPPPAAADSLAADSAEADAADGG